MEKKLELIIPTDTVGEYWIDLYGKWNPYTCCPASSTFKQFYIFFPRLFPIDECFCSFFLPEFFFSSVFPLILA